MAEYETGVRPVAGRAYVFGNCALDLDRGLLLRAGDEVRLRPKSFAVLRYLVEHPNRLVSKDELLRAVWADAFVTEGALTQCVIDIRRALGEDVRHGLRTMPRRGFIFDVDVREMRNSAAPATQPAAVTPTLVTGSQPLRGTRAAPWRHARRWTSVGLAGLLVLVSVLGWRYWPSHGDAHAIRSLAVLPLVNYDPDDDHLADGMTDELITSLATLSALRVTSRTSAMAYKKTDKPSAQVGRELGVDGLIESTYTRSADTVYIRVSLVHAAANRILWTESVDSKVGDARTLQRRLARLIAGRLGIQPTPAEQARLSQPAPVSSEVFSLVQRGRKLEDEGSEASLRTAIGYFERAIASDPQSAQAFAGLADAWYGLSGFYEDPRDVVPQARSAAEQAIALDGDLAEAHATMGLIHLAFDWDAAAAEREFLTALALNPTLARARLHYAAFLTTQARHEDAAREIRLAVEGDPRSVRTHSLAALFLLFTRRYDEAIAIARQGLALQPNSAFLMAWRGIAYAEKSQFAEAVANLERASELDGSPTILALLATAYAAAGKRGEAMQTLGQVEEIAKHRYFCPYEIGSVYAVLGETESAFAYFEKGTDERADCMAWLGVEPWTDPMRADPRYRALLARIGLYPGTS